MDDSIGPPEREETVEYYFPYIDLVPEGDIRVILIDQGVETLSFLKSVPEELSGHRYAPDKWSVIDVLGHINDCERLYMMRAFWFARSMEAPLPSFESELAVETACAAARPWNSHLQEFAAIRASTVELLRDLSPEAWLRRGIASGYQFTVRALAYIAAGHVMHHTRMLRERYL